MTDPSDDDRETLAAELALRVLPADEEARAEALRTADARFNRAVEQWDERIAPMFDEVAPVAPPSGVWPRISAVIGAANDNAIRFWRRWAVGATGLLAASLAAIIVLVAQDRPVAPLAPAPTPAGGVTRVATLSVEGGGTAVNLVYDSATGNLFLAPTDKMVGDRRVPHLWLVMPEGGVQLIGAIDGVATSRHNLGAMMPMAAHASAVAISMEEPGHTPGAERPDGPVVASGELQAL